MKLLCNYNSMQLGHQNEYHSNLIMHLQVKNRFSPRSTAPPIEICDDGDELEKIPTHHLVFCFLGFILHTTTIIIVIIGVIIVVIFVG